MVALQRHRSLEQVVGVVGVLRAHSHFSPLASTLSTLGMGLLILLLLLVLGLPVGLLDGLAVGDVDGDPLGLPLGLLVGEPDGDPLGLELGLALGDADLGRRGRAAPHRDVIYNLVVGTLVTSEVNDKFSDQPP